MCGSFVMNKALDVSLYILKYCCQNSVCNCTNKKLQKLLYYVQAWSLAMRNKKVFAEDIEAWLHGPVVPTIYHKYKEYSYMPIKEDLSSFDSNIFDDDDKKIMDAVLSKYSKFDADFLEMRTHIEKPWLESRQQGKKVIPDDSMKSYYSSLIKK